jgi:hypothetical protein
MNIAVCTKSTIYKMQSEFANSIIYSYWKRMQSGILGMFRGRPVDVSGDGQYDSPGKCCQFCVMFEDIWYSRSKTSCKNNKGGNQ